MKTISGIMLLLLLGFPALAFGIQFAKADDEAYAFEFNAYCNVEGVDVSVAIEIIAGVHIRPETTPFKITVYDGPNYPNCVIPHGADESGHPFIKWIRNGKIFHYDSRSGAVDIQEPGVYTAVYGYPTVPSIESADADGNNKDTFRLSDTLYVYGSQYDPDQQYDIYVVADTAWNDKMIIPPRMAESLTTVASNSSGNIPVTPVWNPSLTLGRYDIIVDVDGDGLYCAGIDALIDDNPVLVTAAFLEVPEYWAVTVLALAGCSTGVICFSHHLHRKHQ